MLDAVPPPRRHIAKSKSWTRLTGLVVAAVLMFFLVVAHQMLLGVLLAAAASLVSWLAVHVRDNGYPHSLGPRRTWFVAVLSTFVFLYAVALAGEVLSGLLVIATVTPVAWVTSPTGPLASR